MQDNAAIAALSTINSKLDEQKTLLDTIDATTDAILEIVSGSGGLAIRRLFRAMLGLEAQAAITATRPIGGAHATHGSPDPFACMDSLTVADLVAIEHVVGLEYDLDLDNP